MRGTNGQTDGRTDGQTDEQKSPCVLQDFVPFGAAAQKHSLDIFKTMRSRQDQVIVNDGSAAVRNRGGDFIPVFIFATPIYDFNVHLPGDGFRRCFSSVHDTLRLGLRRMKGEGKKRYGQEVRNELYWLLD